MRTRTTAVACHAIATLAAGLLLLACGSERRPAPPSTGAGTAAATTGTGAGAGTAAAGPGDASTATGDACTSADDCALSCRSSGTDCCGDLCECRIPYNKEHLAALEAEIDATCPADPACPVADCDRPAMLAVPGCQGGACVVVDVPRPTPCDHDDDCVFACPEVGSCCAAPCAPCDHAVHRDDFAAAQRWHDDNCGGARCIQAKCAPPAHMSEPRCQDHRCVVVTVHP
ncbi:MAG: hypothetical protein H6708_17355 [Kofleriaceae bacterium]|nr:hypothetical protein [Kofleriaceae bacterium]